MDERRRGFLRTPVLAGTIGDGALAIARRASAQHGGHNAPPEMAPRSLPDRGNRVTRSIRGFGEAGAALLAAPVPMLSGTIHSHYL